MSLLSSPKLLRAENRLILLFSRTFQKATSIRTLDYTRELPRNVKRWFGSAVFSKQLDQLITEIIKQSILYADGQMKILTAAETGQATILTQEAVRMSKELSAEVSESIVRMLEVDAIYYEHPTKLAKKIQDLWGGERYKAVRFARTFTADVATASAVHRYRQYGVRYMVFDAKLDDRTSDQCRCLDGTIFDLEKGSVDAYRPPLHFHCRSDLAPLPITEEIDESRIFEKRDFSGALEDPAKVDKVFQNIDKFNEKYRVSTYVLDQDLRARIMFEKGAWVGVDGPALGELAEQIAPKLAKGVVPEAAKPSIYTESTTLKEAETWVKTNTKIAHVDYAGLDVRTANSMNEALARHLELHPELAGKIKYYGTAQGQATLAYKLDLEAATQKFMSVGYDRAKAEQFAQAVVSKYRVPPNNVAHYWKRADDASGIAFNKNAGKYFDRLEENLKRDVASGFHPEGCDSIKSMVDHEFGHALDDLYGIKSDPKFREYYQALSAGEKAAAVSRYGATNADEFIAEAWAEYTNNPTPRPAAKLIGDLISSKVK